MSIQTRTEEEPPGDVTRVRRRRRRSSHDQRRRRSMVVVGLVMITAGVVVLAWLAWQFLGTNWVSERRHADVISELEDGWGDQRAVAQTDFGAAEGVLRVPRFGAEYAVPILAGSSDEVLAAGVGHMDDTASVGERGNYVLAAHRITHGEPFADLPQLREGDLVEIETVDATYTYVLDTGGMDLVVPFTASWVLDRVPVNPDGGAQPPDGVGDRLITLVTCSELFHTDNRSVVFGHLLERVPKVV